MRAASLKPNGQYVIAARSSALVANKSSQKADELRAISDAEDETKFELEEYNSEDEELKPTTASHPSTDPGLSSASLQLMQKLLARTLTVLHDTLTNGVP